MQHDVCTKQRLYDEYIDLLVEDMTATVMEDLLGRPPTQQEVECAVARSFIAT